MKTILAPIDFSEVSRRVIAEAVALTRMIHARLVIIHIVQPPIVTDSDVGSRMSAEYSAAASASAARHLTRLQNRLLEKGLPMETRHEVGYPGQLIIDCAEKLSADYIVLGSHGHGSFYDLIVGSTTGRVLKQARCPVIVVPVGLKKTRKSKSELYWEPGEDLET